MGILCLLNYFLTSKTINLKLSRPVGIVTFTKTFTFLLNCFCNQLESLLVSLISELIITIVDLSIIIIITIELPFHLQQHRNPESGY